MKRMWLSAFLAWLFPGAGHFIEGRKTRGLTIATCLWMMFLIGVLSGGLNYPGSSFNKDSFLLYALNIFARFGNGFGWLISLLFGGTDPEAAARVTYEYGGRLIEIAGLLNYLAIFDCTDISLGRKK